MIKLDSGLLFWGHTVYICTVYKQQSSLFNYKTKLLHSQLLLRMIIKIATFWHWEYY